MNRNDYNLKDLDSDYVRRPEMGENAREDAEASHTFLNRVYNWMAGGLAITGIVAYLVAQSMMANPPNRLTGSEGSIFWSPGFMLLMILVELGLVIWLSAGIRRMQPLTAGICFLLYAAVSGVALAPVFLTYTASAVYGAFFASAGTFAAVSIYGYVTKSDLSGVGSFCYMALIGIIIASLINLFLRSEGFDKVISYIGVFVFIGLTAWDTQKLKQMGGIVGNEGMAYSPEFHKYAILGALSLYLDFINLFLMLLRLFGGRSRD